MANQDVSTSAVEIVPENKRRTFLAIYHNGSVTIHLGKDNSVTTSNGFPLLAGTTRTWKLEVDKETQEETLYTGPIFGIADSGTQDIRYWEDDDTSNTRET